MVAAEVVGTKKNVSTTSDMGQHQKICCSKTYENSL